MCLCLRVLSAVWKDKVTTIHLLNTHLGRCFIRLLFFLDWFVVFLIVLVLSESTNSYFAKLRVNDAANLLSKYSKKAGSMLKPDGANPVIALLNTVSMFTSS